MSPIARVSTVEDNMYDYNEYSLQDIVMRQCRNPVPNISSDESYTVQLIFVQNGVRSHRVF